MRATLTKRVARIIHYTLYIMHYALCIVHYPYFSRFW